MPKDRGGQGGSFAGYQLAAGTYASRLRDKCSSRCRPDPRLFPRETLAGYDEACAAAEVRAEALFEGLLAAGEPIEVSGCDRSPDAPEWLRTPAIYGGASSVRLYSDDWCEPAQFYGDRSRQVWESIPVPPRHRVAKKRP